MKEHEVHEVIQAPVGHLLGYVEMMFHSPDLKEQGFSSAEVLSSLILSLIINKYRLVDKSRVFAFSSPRHQAAFQLSDCFGRRVLLREHNAGLANACHGANMKP